MLINELTATEGKLTMLGGNCRFLELDELSVHYYSDSKSLTTNGNKKEEIKSQLCVIADLMQSDNNSRAQNEAIDKDEEKDSDKFEFLITTTRNIKKRLETKINSLTKQVNELKHDRNAASMPTINAYRILNLEYTSTIEGFLGKENTRSKERTINLKSSLPAINVSYRIST